MTIQEAETQFYDIFPNAENNVIKTGITLDVRDSSNNKLPLEAYKVVKTYYAAESLIQRHVDPSDNTVFYYDAYPGETISVVDDENSTLNGLYFVMGTQDPSNNGLSLHRVMYSSDASSEYRLQGKTVNPSTAGIDVQPSSGYYGLSTVHVNPIDASLDPDLVPGNIKKDVEIFGVTGTFDGGTINNQNKTVDSSTSSQTVICDSGYTGLGQVTVNPYVLDSKTINPSTNSQTVTSSEDGLSSVTVNAVTASIDSNIQAGNIKDGVTILGVTGSLLSATVQNYKAATDITLEDYYEGNNIYVYPDQGYDGIYEVKAFGGHTNNIYTRLRVDSDFMQHVRVEETDTNYIEFYSRSYPHKISASNSGYIVKDCSYVGEIGFYYFYSIDSNVTLSNIITNCPKLGAVRFDSISDVQGGIQGDVSTWINSNEIQTSDFAVGINWSCLTSAYRNPTHNILYAPGSKVTRVFIAGFNEYVTDSIYLEYSTGLNEYGVYNVLNALDLTVTGKSVTFASGLTVTDTYGGGLQQKYNQVVNAGWTINNLTIIPYGS